MTADLYRQIRDEELTKLGSGGRLKDAAAVLDELVLSRDFLPFPDADRVSAAGLGFRSKGSEAVVLGPVVEPHMQPRHPGPGGAEPHRLAPDSPGHCLPD